MMRKYSWDHIQRIIKAIVKNGIGIGGTVDMKPVHVFPHNFWVEFLNADPSNSQSIWPVYRGVVRYIQDLGDSLEREGYDLSEDIRDIELLSKEDFLKLYPVEMQEDATKLHTGMTEAIDNGRVDLVEGVLKSGYSEAKEIITKGADIPPLPLWLRVHHPDPGILQIQIPGSGHRRFWLSVILSGMVSAFRDGKIVARRCEAADCRKLFIPYSRTRNQRFHSPSCRSTYHTRKRRSSMKKNI